MIYIQEVSSYTFDQNVLHSSSPVLVHFWAEWSTLCRQTTPLLQDIAQKYQGKLAVVRVDVDNNNQLAGVYGIQKIPTLHFFKNGVSCEHIVGLQTSVSLQAFVERNL